MKKTDLKSGMVVSTSADDMIVIGKSLVGFNFQETLCNFTEDLIHQDDCFTINRIYNAPENSDDLYDYIENAIKAYPIWARPSEKKDSVVRVWNKYGGKTLRHLCCICSDGFVTYRHGCTSKTTMQLEVWEHGEIVEENVVLDEEVKFV